MAFGLIYRFISEMIQDTAIVTMEDEYELVHSLSKCAIFNDLERTIKLSGLFVPEIVKSCLNLSNVRPKYYRSHFFPDTVSQKNMRLRRRQYLELELFVYKIFGTSPI